MEIISLCGTWSFRPDTENGAVWDVEVPGSWKTVPALKGCPSGVYSRRFRLDAGQLQKRLLLRFGGVYRSAEVILNGMPAGSHNGFQSPFRLDITDIAREGENHLEVRVNGERPKGEYPGFSSIYELIPLDFDGIYEPVTLEIRERCALTALYTPIRLAEQKALFIFSALSDAAKDARLDLRVLRAGTRVFSRDFEITAAEGESEISLDVPLEPFELWSPEHPVLYDVEARLTVNGITDLYTVRTGFKCFETRGTDFYLNGRPYYLLGYGDDFTFPDGMPSAVDSGYYRHGILRAKEYGFNFARHHSHYPFEAYLDAADELGLLIQPELALANLPREWIDERNTQLFLDEWRSLIRACRFHPCIAAWCGGNEMEWGFPFSKEMYAEAKRLDPYRPVQSTDGCFMACDVDDTFDYAGIVPGEYTDYLPYRELDRMFTRDFCGKPQVVHEMGNYANLYDLSLLPRFETSLTGSAKITAMNELVIRKNLRGLYDQAYTNSLALEKLCHKLNIEKVRLSPFFCGYHLWTLIDYYETTQGLLNSFYEDKAFTADEFRQINRQCLLLWDTGRYVFRAGETLPVRIMLSRFGSDLPMSGTLTVSLTEDSRTLAERSINFAFSGHGLTEAGCPDLLLPDTDREKEYTLTARLESENETLTNSWTLFCVPSVKIRREKEIYIHYLSRHLFENDSVPVRHFTIPQPIGSGQLIVTSHLFGGMIEAVENGSSMLLLAERDTFRETVTKNSFKSPWWDPGEIWYLNHTNNRQISCVVEDCPATAMLPYSGSWKLDLFGAVEQAPAIDIDALGLDVEPLVYGLSTDLDRFAYLFQFRLKKGRVLVCSFNHARSDLKDPAVEYILKELINYAMSDAFVPSKLLSRGQFLTALNR